MYYEEKIINGVLMCRRNPKGDWEQCSITKMSSDIIELKQQLADLKADNEELKAKWEQVLCENLDLSAGIAAFRASQNRVRADAVREAKKMTVLSHNTTNKDYETGFDDGIEAYDKQLDMISEYMEAGNE